MTSLVGRPVFVSTPRSASNSAEDFLQFVAKLIADGVLVAGDVFVVDNCSIHYADSIADMLDEILAAADVKMSSFQPTVPSSTHVSWCSLR